MLRQTSLQAFKSLRDEGTLGEQALTILKFIKNNNIGWTRNELSRELSIRINAISGRCNMLVNDGWLKEEGTKLDEFSNRQNLILWYKEED